MDILSGLTPNDVTATPATSPQAQQPPVTSDSNPLHPVLEQLVSGKLAGISIPVGFKSAEVDALVPNAATLTKLGLKFFRPMVDKTVALAVVSPKFTDKALLQKADEAGKVADVFPSITDFFPHEADQTPDATAGLSDPSAMSAPQTAPAAPANAPSATPVPVVRAAAPNAALGRARVANLNAGTPSSRPIPGGGLVLNSLLKPTV